MSSPEERWRDAENHRASLIERVAAVVHVPYDSAVRGHDGAGSGGGNAQEEHHLAAQELSDAGAQDLPAIGLSADDRTDGSHISQAEPHLLFGSEVRKPTTERGVFFSRPLI